MKFRTVLWVFACGLTCFTALFAFQRPFRELPGVEYTHFERPDDWAEQTEFAFARLMFPSGWNDGYRPRYQGDWHLGLTLWTQDFPRADRHFSAALRRLTRIHVRSVEQLVNLDEGDAYDWPWLYAVQVGGWGLTDTQAAELRDYLLRGGFFFADDFHGATELEVFTERMKKVFPERPIVEIENPDPIFHTVYDLDDRFQIPGAAHVYEGCKACREGGIGAHWRAIYDDKGRIMVAITYNSDVGDAWEWADDASYPAKFSQLAIRIGVNYIVYAMTH